MSDTLAVGTAPQGLELLLQGNAYDGLQSAMEQGDVTRYRVYEVCGGSVSSLTHAACEPTRWLASPNLKAKLLACIKHIKRK